MLLSDIVRGPYQDPVSGPFAEFLKDDKCAVRVKVCPERINVFDLRRASELCQPDLICMFGIWSNVLTKEIVEDCGVEEQWGPNPRERRFVQHSQKGCFGEGPHEFVIAALCAIAAQSNASIIIVGPRHYMWNVTEKSARPMQKFKVKPADYYQGYRKFREDFISLYLPSGASQLVEVDGDGFGDLRVVLQKHESILSVGTGRGTFWKNILGEFLVGQHSLEACPMPSISKEWGNSSLDDTYWEMLDECTHQYCGDPYRCKRCLMNIKKWAGIHERKHVRPTRNACTQTMDCWTWLQFKCDGTCFSFFKWKH